MDVAWATAVAVGIGVAGGVTIGNIVWKLRGQQHKHDVFDDLVGLGLIAIVYGLSLLVSAWGFLAVFFAAVALRHTELKLARAIGVKPEQLGAGVEEPIASKSSSSPVPPQIVSAEALIFKEHLERLSELLLVFLVGGMLLLDYWNWRTLSLAVFVLVVARPLSVIIGLMGTQTSWRVRGIAGWFGVRGIGSGILLNVCHSAWRSGVNSPRTHSTDLDCYHAFYFASWNKRQTVVKAPVEQTA